MKEDIATAMIRMFEYGKTFNKPDKPKRRMKKMRDLEDFSITDMIHRELEKTEALQKLLKDYEKANKKDEKKDDKKDNMIGIYQLAILMVFTFPIIAPLYVMYVKTLLH